MTYFSLLFCFLMIRRPTRSTRTDTPFPYTTLFRSQCLAFAADRERDLQNLPLRRLFISTDRQDYQVNWTDRKNDGNVQLTAVVSAENRTGYVFPMSLNYDPDVDVAAASEAASEAAKANGDFRSEEHTSELQSLMRISYAVFCLKKKN